MYTTDMELLSPKEMTEFYGTGVFLKKKKAARIRTFAGNSMWLQWDLPANMVKVKIGDKSAVVHLNELNYLLRNV